MMAVSGLVSEPTFAGRPFVHVNVAIDAQGRVADDGVALDLSCATDWRRVHALRERYTAIAVGARTWVLDRPRLTARLDKLGRAPRRQPVRVLFAGSHAIDPPPDGRPTFLVGAAPAGGDASHIACGDRSLDGPLAVLASRGVASMLVEGGPTLLRSFFECGYVDRLTVFVREPRPARARRAVGLCCWLPRPFLSQLQASPLGEGTLLAFGRPLEPTLETFE